MRDTNYSSILNLNDSIVKGSNGDGGDTIPGRGGEECANCTIVSSSNSHDLSRVRDMT